jgi:drug/metabolite transporter (DMT)-like permease
MANVGNLAVAVPCALGAAAAFAVANVEQMRAARRADAPEGVSAKLLVRLVRDPQWLIGFAASVGGYALQATALFLAPVVLVQPLIVTELLFALPLAAAVAGRRLNLREWIGALVVAGGISSFLVVGNPSGDANHASVSTTLEMALVAGLVVIALVVFAETLHSKPMARASGLALAASICFGMLSVMTKIVGHQFQHEKLAALLHFQPYLLAVAALTGLLLAQTAFRIAPLSVSLPLIDIGEPLVASLLAVIALHEKLDIGAGTAAGVAVSAAAVAVGVALLDSSPLVRAAQADVTEMLRANTSEDVTTS